MHGKNVILNVTATSDHLDIKAGVVTYKTNINLDLDNNPAFLLLPPGGVDKDMVIMNPLYTGGALEVKMKPLKPSHAKKFAVGDVVAVLVVSDNVKTAK